MRDFCELIVNRMLVIEELEKRGKKMDSKGEDAQLGNESETRAQNPPATRRIGTKELAEKLKVLARKDSEYFKPSLGQTSHNLQVRSHCIVLPKPLYQVKDEAKARAEERRREA